MWSRVVALAACSAALAGCSSSTWSPNWSAATSWMPSMSMPSFSGGGASGIISVESDPPGAEAKTSTGSACRTPCNLTVTANRDFTVSFALNGYQPKTVPVAVIVPPGEDTRDAAGSAGVTSAGLPTRFEPNPVFAELTAEPRRKRSTPPARPRVSSKPAPPPAMAAEPDPSTSAQYPAGGGAWPTPR